MDRRGFLRLLGGAAAGAMVAPAAVLLPAVVASEPIVEMEVWSLDGVLRGTYPGRLSTPAINLRGAILTPSVVRRARAHMKRALS